jgi:hypothetical protein
MGYIATVRVEATSFDEKQVQLIRSFADQAVIAIENARLFNETKEALEQQKASGEILSTISSSIADTNPVFDKILESCERLFEGHFRVSGWPARTAWCTSRRVAARGRRHSLSPPFR